MVHHEQKRVLEKIVIISANARFQHIYSDEILEKVCENLSCVPPPTIYEDRQLLSGLTNKA